MRRRESIPAAMRRKTGWRARGRAAVASEAVVGRRLVCLSGFTWPLRVLEARRRRWAGVVRFGGIC